MLDVILEPLISIIMELMEEGAAGLAQVGGGFTAEYLNTDFIDSLEVTSPPSSLDTTGCH